MLRDKVNLVDKTELPPRRVLEVLAFFLGLSVTTGVIYAFIVGSTPVYVGYFAAIVICIILFIIQPKEIYNSIRHLDASVLLFVGTAALSIIPALFYCLLGWFDSTLLTTVLKGLVVLVAGIVVYIAALSLRRQRNSLIYGVGFGVVLNVVTSFFAQVAFDSGSVWTLATVFPQDAFVVSLHWGVPEPPGSHAIYTFRAQGLFLEASHMMVFLVAWGMLCVVGVRHLLTKVVLVSGIIYLSVQALSPNVGILLMEVLLFAAAGDKFRHLKCADTIWIKYNTLITVIILVSIINLACAFFGNEIIESVRGGLDAIASSLADFDVSSTTDTGTTERFKAMTSAISVLPYFPFGAGWNTESIVLTAHFGNAIFASHSFALRLLLEVGMFGFVAYCWMLYRHVSAAFSTGSYGRLAGMAIACMAMAQFMNGITLLPYVWLLLGLSKGLAIGTRREKRDIHVFRRGGGARWNLGQA